MPPAAFETISVGGTTHDGYVDYGHLEAMRAVWSAFKDSVETADEIVVIGYSLPGTDLAAIEVMKGFAKNASPCKRLFIVDKDKGIVERYRRIVWPDAESVCDDFRKFDPDTL